MSLERYHLPHRDDPTGDCGQQRPRRGHLEELRQKGDQVSRAAQGAIAKALSAGDPERQLKGLINTGGQ